MKKSLITTLIAAPLLSLSSMAFASEPMQLSAAQMDGVTAGFFSFKYADIKQFNASPVTVAQANVLTIGGGNVAKVVSGNTAVIKQ
jgi:hypothetical protein